jgi:hypothetical protein
MQVTAKSRKDDIWAAYEARLQQPTTWGDVWGLAVSTARTIAKEVPLAMRDAYNAGSAVRNWVLSVVDELNRPLLKS